MLGSVESIEALSRQAIAGCYRRRYRPGALVVAAAGNVDHATVVGLVRQAFEQAGALGATDERPVPARLARPSRSSRSRRGRVSVVSRPTEQANLVLGGWGVARTDDRRFALGVLSSALGGGMSSRLFQEVREKRGLAYSVYATRRSTRRPDCSACTSDALPRRWARSSTSAAPSSPPSGTRESVRRNSRVARVRWGSLVLGLEDTGSRMSRLGKSELVYGELMSVGEILDHIDAVTGEDVRAVARDVVANSVSSLAVIGPFAHDQFVDAVADDVVVAAVLADAPVAPAVACTVAAAVAFVAAVAHSGRRPRRKGPYGQRNDPRGCRGG